MRARGVKGEKADRVRFNNSSDAAACCVQTHYYGLGARARPLGIDQLFVSKQTRRSRVVEETERDSRKGQIPHNSDPFERRQSFRNN